MRCCGSRRDNGRHGLFIPSKAATPAPRPPPRPHRRSQQIESPHTHPQTHFLLTSHTQCVCARARAGNTRSTCHAVFPVRKRAHFNQSQGQYSAAGPELLGHLLKARSRRAPGEAGFICHALIGGLWLFAGEIESSIMSRLRAADGKGAAAKRAEWPPVRCKGRAF